MRYILDYLRNLRALVINLVRPPQKIVLDIEYRSQWESPELNRDILDGIIKAHEDPNWSQSGFQNPQEYSRWSWNACGITCLQMALKSLIDQDIKKQELASELTEYGAYEIKGEKIVGLIYQPTVSYLHDKFGIESRVASYMGLQRIIREVQIGNFVVLSVSPYIREPEKENTYKGGHLVLVTGYDPDSRSITIHNPSGFHDHSQVHYVVSKKMLDRYFAKRGLVVHKP